MSLTVVENNWLSRLNTCSIYKTNNSVILIPLLPITLKVIDTFILQFIYIYDNWLLSLLM